MKKSISPKLSALNSDVKRISRLHISIEYELQVAAQVLVAFTLQVCLSRPLLAIVILVLIIQNHLKICYCTANIIWMKTTHCDQQYTHPADNSISPDVPSVA